MSITAHLARAMKRLLSKNYFKKILKTFLKNIEIFGFLYNSVPNVRGLFPVQ
jgi:hypothetical protein